MKEKIENAIGLVYTVVEALCRLVLIFMVCTVTAQVISRALGGNIKWCEEVMLILLDTMMFLLLPVGIKDDLHIRIEVFAKYFPRKVKIFLLYFSNAILLVVSLCMIRYGFFLMEKTNSKFYDYRSSKKISVSGHRYQWNSVPGHGCCKVLWYVPYEIHRQFPGIQKQA